MPHNHSVRCCCTWPEGAPGVISPDTCPSCVEHGELANLNTPANTPAQPAECPSCHAIGDQPHTDYCRAGLHTTHRWGKVMRGQINFPEVCVNCLVRADRPDAQLACPRYDQVGQTSQPAATTSQPATHHRCQQDGGVMCSGSIDCECKQAQRRGVSLGCTGIREPQLPGIKHTRTCPHHPDAPIT